MDESKSADKIAARLIEITKPVVDATIRAKSLEKEELKAAIEKSELTVEKSREKMEYAIIAILAAVGGLFGVMINQTEFNHSLKSLNVVEMLSQNIFGTIMLIILPVAFTYFMHFHRKYLGFELNRKILVEIYLERF